MYIFYRANSPFYNNFKVYLSISDLFNVEILCPTTNLPHSNGTDLHGFYGDSYTVSCDTGYLHGDRLQRYNVTCQADGQWDGQDGCQGIITVHDFCFKKFDEVYWI